MTLPSSARRIIFCDCGYGWPTQKRPRSERVRAVARQIFNFTEWQREQRRSLRHADRCSTETPPNDDLGTNDAPPPPPCRLVVIGDNQKSQINPLREQMKKVMTHPTVLDDIDFVTTYPDAAPSDEEDNGDVVYLSPDAADALDPESPPPRRVVVGMIVDRQIRVGRSKRRSDALAFRSAKFPLELLNWEGLVDREPLNIDTVMEIMQRWWDNYDEMVVRGGGVDEVGEETATTRNGDLVREEGTCDESLLRRKRRNKDCFVDAAVCAMKSHQERHPNRTIHKEFEGLTI